MTEQAAAQLQARIQRAETAFADAQERGASPALLQRLETRLTDLYEQAERADVDRNPSAP